MQDTVRLEIENAAVEISPEGLQKMLNGQGADLHFSELEFRLSAAAVQALVAQLFPSDGTPARAEVTPNGVMVEAGKDGRQFRIRLDATAIRLQPGQGEIRLVTEKGTG
jgi:hypothetical protein